MEIFFLKVGQKTFGTRLWAAFSSLLHYKWKMERSFHCCSMSSLLQLLRQSNTYAKKRCVSFQYRIAPEFFIVFIIVYVQRTPTGTAKLEKVWNLPYNRSNKTFLLFLYWWRENLMEYMFSCSNNWNCISDFLGFCLGVSGPSYISCCAGCYRT